MSGALVLGVAGCAAIPVLNPEFLAAIGLGQTAAALPDEAPALVVGVDNLTNNTIDARISYRERDGRVIQQFYVLGPGEKTADSLICPIPEVTLGDVGDLEAIGAIVRLGGGTPDDAFIEVEPFGVLLQDEANYNCGDQITFQIVPSGSTLSGFQVLAFVQRAP